MPTAVCVVLKFKLTACVPVGVTTCSDERPMLTAFGSPLSLVN